MTVYSPETIEVLKRIKQENANLQEARTYELSVSRVNYQSAHDRVLVILETLRGLQGALVVLALNDLGEHSNG